MAIDNDEPVVGDLPRRKHTPIAPAAPPAAAPAPPAPKEVYGEEDPRVRAARRAAELREHWGAEIDDGTDEFWIDPRVIPEGWSYEWKMWTVLNAENPSYQVQLARKGWEPVPAYRHPEMMPDTYKGATIERKGMRLMERPLEITQAAVAADKRRARAQVSQKEEQLAGAPAGPNSPFPADNDGAGLVKIKRSFESVQIPK